ncbi:MAG: hypothetical protein IT518_14535 [Burkholderiales bacterium]|nr:hypothetical protein [Burkholderiales bacterium]
MSGPITCGYVIFQGLLLLSQRALQEARAMRREYGDVLAQLAERERSLRQAQQGQRDARLERIAAVRGEADRQFARFERLRGLADTLGIPAVPRALPAAPSGDDDAAWSSHLRALEDAVRELERLLTQAGSAFGDKLRTALAATSAAPTIDDALSAYVLQRQMKPGLAAEHAERFRQTAARILSRLPLAEGVPLPAELDTLAKAIVLAPTIERADMLATQLRQAVQRHGEAHAAQQDDTAAARRLLDEMPEDAPAPLLRALEQVAAGVARLDPALRDAAQAALDEAAADREGREQAAAAFVLQESLRDLGYEVEDIEATLFADGGTVHFRRDGWDNYFVRLRLDSDERTVNFNVVRAQADAESEERRRQDVLAEDRWCAEFPKLMQTLAARGLQFDVQRRLEAGAVPVQVVDPASVPRIAPKDEGGDVRAPKARRIADT